MAYLLDDVMDTVRLQYGEPLELRVGSVDLVSLVREVLHEYPQSDPGHELILHASDSLIGQWDGQRLRRVVENLLSNAIKYSPEGQQVIVRIELQDKTAQLSVQDFGLGIGAEDLPLLFEPFKRGRNAAGIAGSGIGLLSVKRLVELHGGSVDVQSSPGEGSTFTVRLPLKEGRRHH